MSYTEYRVKGLEFVKMEKKTFEEDGLKEAMHKASGTTCGRQREGDWVEGRGK